MSYNASDIPCPKCGYPTKNPEVCESCGALLSRIRGREYLSAANEVNEYGEQVSVPQATHDPDPFDDSFEYRAPRPWLPYTVLALIAAGAVGGFLFLQKNRNSAPESSAVVAAGTPAAAPAEIPPPAATPEPSPAPASPTPLPSPAARAQTPAPVPQLPPAEGNVAEEAKPVLGWLDSLKGRNNEVTVSAGTPGGGTGTPRPAPTSRPANPTPAAAASARSTAKTGSDIQMGEELFSSAQDPGKTRAAAVLEQLESRSAPATQGSPTPGSTPVVQLIKVTDETFLAEVGMHADTPVLAGFYDPTHPSAGQILQVLLGMQQTFGEQLKVVAVDVAEGKSVASRFSANGPTMILLRRGRELGRAANPMSQPDVQTFVAALLSSQN